MNVDMQAKMREAICRLDDEPNAIVNPMTEVARILNRDRLKTPKEFAEITGLSYKFVLKLMREKGFPAFRLLENSRNFLIDTEAVPEWLAKQMKKPKRPMWM